MLVNTDSKSYLEFYEFKKIRYEGEQTLTLVKSILVNQNSVELKVCKTNPNYVAVGDSEGNIYVLSVIQEEGKIYTYKIK
jgi:hypothetical protein